MTHYITYHPVSSLGGDFLFLGGEIIPNGIIPESITVILRNITVWEYKVVDLYLFYMKVTISESKLTKVIHNYINMSFEGFDNCYYDWADFNCGMGICCDPYAIGFVLPDREHDDYLFKLVNIKYYDDDGDYPKELMDELPEPCYNSPDISDEEFDLIVLSEEMYERLESLFGDINIWSKPLLNIINGVFDTNALTVLYF